MKTYKLTYERLESTEDIDKARHPYANGEVIKIGEFLYKLTIDNNERQLLHTPATQLDIRAREILKELKPSLLEVSLG